MLSPKPPVKTASSPVKNAGSAVNAFIASPTLTPVSLLKSHTCFPASSIVNLPPAPKKNEAIYQPLDTSINTFLPALLAAAKIESKDLASSSLTTLLS